MNDADRNTHGTDNKASETRLTGSERLVGNVVCNEGGEKLGNIKEIMLDTASGNVCYAVLSFGGILGIGSKLFAVPWYRLKFDSGKKHFVLNVDKDRLKNAPGFDKNHWPDMADKSWDNQMHSYYAAMK
ncbi:PRC-barrel domain-containing protein [Nitrosomonas sp. Is24]|uniref:PRC-barrel domain-containing protein n=1 Tax=Nitrosomonas sp. Is24 TaxID=3080533 RepID=UPI00294B343A|nr:PRC-barrel domain-containing protein [Nitrosomonas sp. Is24]MDV6342766.1 PRC-barrel domain-containing protein [Nitrosomonas sp. Is24]